MVCAASLLITLRPELRRHGAHDVFTTRSGNRDVAGNRTDTASDIGHEVRCFCVNVGMRLDSLNPHWVCRAQFETTDATVPVGLAFFRQRHGPHPGPATVFRPSRLVAHVDFETVVSCPYSLVPATASRGEVKSDAT